MLVSVAVAVLIYVIGDNATTAFLKTPPTPPVKLLGQVWYVDADLRDGAALLP